MGERFEVVPERVAHGGFVVARHEGVVVFVRHALPGERVVAEVTEGHEGDRFLRADAVRVLVASTDRVEPPCPFSGPGRCGGCDFQHVSLEGQRELKAAVVSEQLARLAHVDQEVRVEPVPLEGVRWRTRVQWAVDADGVPGLRKHRSHDVVRVDDCRIAHPGLPDVTSSRWPDATSVEAIGSAAGEQLRLVTVQDEATFADGPVELHERAGGRSWQVSGSGFWQVHPAAASTLVSAVLDGLSPRAGERAFDLYGGVGLFAGALVDAGCWVWALESGRTAVAAARRNLADAGGRARSSLGRVEQGLARLPSRTDLVVLDPPRTGAGARVLRDVLARKPRAVAYVACDPAALARDLATAVRHGYVSTSIRAFDLFPMTQHVECVAVLRPG